VTNDLGTVPCDTNLLERFCLPAACNPDPHHVHDEADIMTVYVLLDYVRHDYQSSLFLCTSAHTKVSANGIKACFVCLPAHLSLHASCLDRH